MDETPEREQAMSKQHTTIEFWRRFVFEDSGTTAVEYAVMLAMILAVIIATIGSLGSGQNSMWGNIDGEMQAHGIN